MDDIAINSARPQSHDYDVPADFRLREHARSRHAWEIGEGDAAQVRVRFRRKTGASLSAAALGQPVADAEDERMFEVRRPDSFARWLLSFGGDAVPTAPESMVEEFQRQARDTRDLYYK